FILKDSVNAAREGIKSNYKADARYYLALHYKDGKPKPIINDHLKAYDLFKKVSLSDLKYKDDAKYYLALHYKDINKDAYSAYKFFKQVEVSNSRYKDEAAYYLAFFYKDGICIEKNEKIVFKNFTCIAQSNSIYKDDAKFILAKCYETGIGVKKDTKTALINYSNLLGKNLDYFMKNRFKNDYKNALNAAKFELATYYTNGKSDTKDVDKACQLFKELSNSVEYQKNALNWLENYYKNKEESLSLYLFDS
ncbi:32875_t:CDS:2, partial [Racocetra persica]